MKTRIAKAVVDCRMAFTNEGEEDRNAILPVHQYDGIRRPALRPQKNIASARCADAMLPMGVNQWAGSNAIVTISTFEARKRSYQFVSPRSFAVGVLPGFRI